MQLQMTAPLDIGLEQTDPTLRLGQDDIFDLDETTRGLRRKGGLGTLGDNDDVDSSDEEMDDAGDGDEDVLDSEEERDRKVGNLEAELDGMYDAYQERLKERDAKYKVKEARKNQKDREEWGGLSKARDSDNSDEESDEEGGWDVVQKSKGRADHDSDSDDSDMDDDSAPATSVRPAKRTRGSDPQASKPSKRARFQETPEDPTVSRNAQLWFSQSLFKGTGLSDVEDDEEDEEDVMEVEEDGVNAETSSEAEVRFDWSFVYVLFSYISPFRTKVMTTSRSYHKHKTMETSTCGT